MSSKTQIGKETNDINPSIQWFGNMFAAKSVPRHKVKQWCSTEQKHGQFQFILFPGLHSKATSLAPRLSTSFHKICSWIVALFRTHHTLFTTGILYWIPWPSILLPSPSPYGTTRMENKSRKKKQLLTRLCSQLRQLESINIFINGNRFSDMLEICQSARYDVRVRKYLPAFPLHLKVHLRYEAPCRKITSQITSNTTGQATKRTYILPTLFPINLRSRKRHWRKSSGNATSVYALNY